MARKYLFFVILAAFIIVGVFGMPLMLSGHAHHALCPFLSDVSAVCPFSTLIHMKHWQSAFAIILLEILALGVFVLTLWRAPLPIPKEHVRWRSFSRIPDRPTLIEELFRRGILNRKEPSLFFAVH